MRYQLQSLIAVKHTNFKITVTSLFVYDNKHANANTCLMYKLEMYINHLRQASPGKTQNINSMLIYELLKSKS